MTNYKQLCADLVEIWDSTADFDYNDFGNAAADLVVRARAALAEPELEPPTYEEIIKLMPQQMHEDLAAAARALAEQAGTDSTRAKGVMRIILRCHVVDHARAVLAKWGGPTPQPVPVSERLPGPADCLDEGWAWFFNQRIGWRQAVLPVSPGYTHWIPANALPIPEALDD